MSQENEAVCSLEEVLPMAEWLEREKDGECRPCSIAVLIKDYQKTLSEAGRGDLSDGFAGLVEDDDPVMKAAELMDRAKEEVNGEVKQRLRLLDCMAQTSQI